VLIGVRLGGTLALLDGAELGADAVVAWALVVSCRRYAREIRLLSVDVPQHTLPHGVGGARVSAGTVFSEPTLEAVSALDVTLIASAPAPRIVLLDGAPQADAADHLRGLGAEIEQHQIDGGQSALESPAEYATVPGEIVRSIRSWVGHAATVKGTSPAGRTLASMS
jgi:hypothetical protein